MLLAVAIFVGLMGAWALGARLSLLADLRLRGIALVFAALGVQLVIFTPLTGSLPDDDRVWLHYSTYLMLLVFLVVNIRRPGLWIAFTGFVTNLVAILANGGRMPVSLPAWKASGGDVSISNGDAYNNVFIADAHTHFSWLGDIFALPARLPLANALSIGDVLLIAGMTTFVYRVCGPPKLRSTAKAFEPLRFHDFRRLLAGRMVSKFGDWLTMTAVVTWAFESTRSTAVVSIFLVARISSATLGGLAAAPVLGRVSQMRVLSIVELFRGALAIVMLPFATHGELWPVIALVCLSYFLGSATNPSASSLVPDLLPADVLHAGNGLHGVSRQVVMVVGAALGGFSVNEFGITAALVIDLVTFIAAALFFLHLSSKHAVEMSGTPEESPSWRDLSGALLRSRAVLALTLSFAVVTAAMGLLNASLPQFFADRLGKPDGYGYAMAMIAAGLLCGELLTTFVRHESVARRSVALAFLTSALAMVVLADSTVEATAYLMLFVLGASDGSTEIVYDTLFQLELPRRLRSGIFALASALQNVGMVIGLGLAPILLRSGSTSLAVTASGVGCLLGAAIAAAGLIRRVSPHADEFGSRRAAHDIEG